MSWYSSLRGIASKGSQAERPGSLAGLAEARRVHLGQFFTPDAVAQLMWRIVGPAMDTALIQKWRTAPQVSILDNSVGSGRLLQFTDPDKHALYGVDVDQATLTTLGKSAEEAGFACTFEACGMEAIHPHHFDVALINPPFSIHLDSPILEPYPCTSYGRFGPNSSATSHAYALAQAVEAAELVVALLPSTFAEEVRKDPLGFLEEKKARRLRALIELPSGVFKEEGTDVRVSLLVFGMESTISVSPQHIRLTKLDEDLPDFGLKIHGRGGYAKLAVRGFTDEGPSITLPVTGDRTVRVTHDSRKISLHFKCGLTQAKVLNAVYRSRTSEDGPPAHLHRRPKGFIFSGQGALDMEVHLAQDNPTVSFQSLLTDMEQAGAKLDVDTGIMQYLERRIRKSKRQGTPLRHTVWVPEGVAGHDKVVTGRARKPHVADPKVWGSPFIAPMQQVVFYRQQDGSYLYEVAGREFRLTPEDLYERFEVSGGAAKSGWTVVHPGLVETFPVMADALSSRAKTLGIDAWLTWGFQWHDLIETAMKPKGSIIAWEMGLGKARLGAALIKLIGARHGLIAVEGGLIDEMERELKGLPIPASDWRIISRPEQLDNLRQVNVISYERLRMSIGRSNDTYGRRLRRRIGVLVADEGDLLANPESAQSRALWAISPKRRFILTATPLANYPRDVLPVMVYACGDSTAAQPWGWRRGYMEQNWRNSVAFAARGIDAFRKAFVTLDWVTREFEDTGVEGAKREIPKIANVEMYRAMLAPHVKRRLVREPEVEEYVKILPEHRSVIDVPWDDAHLAYYLQVAEEFSSWYTKQRRVDGKRSNLIAILARIRAVSFASDYPQHGVEGFGPYMPLTSKQRWAIDELERLTHEGHKTILYVENPGQVDLITEHLRERGVDSVSFHGKIPIKRRTRELYQRFRYGDCPNLVATLGVTQKGLNIPEADQVMLLGRSWSATVEEQAIRRPLRPQQKKNVRVRYGHLPGGIDQYKDQLVTFKRDSAQAGLDWGTPETDGVEFLHLDTLMERFVSDLARLREVNRHDIRKVLAGGVYA